MNKKVLVTGLGAALASGLLLTASLSGAAAEPGSTSSKKSGGDIGTLAQQTGPFVSVAPGANGIATITCPANTIVTGGGGATSGFDIFFTDSFASGNGWVIRGTNRGSTAQSIRATAICIG